ncbi:MAG: CpaF family protein [Streptomycetaceae bacterium]|jgi:pilus assembly protein CpaF|nr:MAG: CpaF family protein [Streptomycetaceae bacterium]
MDLDIDITFGAIADFMKDPTIEEIWINSPERIFIARSGRSELTNLLLTTDDVRNIVERALMWSGRRLDLSHPFVDARLPDGSRLHVAIPEITATHWAVNIRKHLMGNFGIDDLVDRKVMTPFIATALKNSVRAGLNILVSGGTQAGKTTMLNALAGAIPRTERVVTIEEVFELSPQLPDVVALQTRSANLQGDGEIPLRRLIKESLRMRPSRIIVGEVREAEALDLLIALNSGLPGMGTLHANSPRDAIIKLQTLPLLAGENISHKFIAPTVASAFDLIVHVSLDHTGMRRINEIAALTGRYENDRAEIETLWSWNGKDYDRGIGTLPHPDKFALIGAPLASWWRQ